VVNPKSDTHFNDLLFVLGAIALSSLFFLHLTIKWEWSFLMDEIGFKSWMPYVTDVFRAFNNEVISYWHEGRFNPVKYLANLLKWRYFPTDPLFFHYFDFLLLLTSAYVGVLAVFESQKQVSYKWFIFALGAIILQRPLLDIIALDSISEGWVVFFFSLGTYCFLRKNNLYRLFFILCGLSKEPGTVALFGTGITYLVLYFRETTKKISNLINAGVDLFIFLFLVIVALKAKDAGPYLRDYQFVSTIGLKLFFVGFLKIGIGFLPFVFLISVFNRRFEISKLNISCTVFGISYLFLVSPRNVSGYLICPAAFAFYLVILSLFFSTVNEKQVSKNYRYGFSAIFLIVLFSSLFRYERFERSINESTRAFTRLLKTTVPRFILVNGVEASTQGNHLASQYGAMAQIKVLDDSSITEASHFNGQAIVFELSTYFGKISDATIGNIALKIGGWESVEDNGVYRIFYGHLRESKQ
jgi:hypothetical protein